MCEKESVCEEERERERERERENINSASHMLYRCELHGVHGLQCFM